MLTKLIRSFIYALNGLLTTWVEEFNFRVEIIIAILVTLVAGLAHFTWIESAFCFVVITIVLSAEIVNTAVEDLCNKVELKHDPVIAKIKDTMAGFVFLSSLGAIAIGILVFWHHFM